MMLTTHTIKTDANASELEPVYKTLDSLARDRSKLLKSREKNPGVLTRSRYCDCQLAPLNVDELLRNVKPTESAFHGVKLFAAMGDPVVKLGPVMTFNEAVKILGNASNVYRALKFLNASPVGKFTLEPGVPLGNVTIETGSIIVEKVGEEYNKRQLVRLFCTCEGAAVVKLRSKLFTTTPRKKFNDVLVAEMLEARKRGLLIGRATHQGILTVSYPKSLESVAYYSTVK